VDEQARPGRRLLLVRHGLPDYSFGLAEDEPPGPPLSSIGVKQVRQAMPVLRQFGPAVLYSSPLARTRQSAELIGEALGLPVRIDNDLKEWHRTESLHQVNERSAHWLRRWLADGDACAAMFGHASPLLSVLRTALFLPHSHFWTGNDHERLVLYTADRFEFSMASVFELLFEPETVTARCLHHPQPRIVYYNRRRGAVADFPRPTMTGENREIRRPNFGRLIGYRTTPAAL
jgi:2,3-bisphosphoglycerate-dependent phosphoglycerate mutase